MARVSSGGQALSKVTGSKNGYSEILRTQENSRWATKPVSVSGLSVTLAGSSRGWRVWEQ